MKGAEALAQSRLCFSVFFYVFPSTDASGDVYASFLPHQFTLSKPPCNSISLHTSSQASSMANFMPDVGKGETLGRGH